MCRHLQLRVLFSSTLIFVLVASGTAQITSTTPKPPADLSSWQHVQALPVKTKVHVTTDTGGTTCKLFAVSEDTLTCATGSKAKTAGKIIQRSAVKRIKLTRYGVSSAAGAVIGLGAGSAVGAAATQSGSWFRGADIAIVAALGGLVGLTVGDGTDFTRGPTVYVRP